MWSKIIGSNFSDAVCLKIAGLHKNFGVLKDCRTIVYSMVTVGENLNVIVIIFDAIFFRYTVQWSEIFSLNKIVFSSTSMKIIDFPFHLWYNDIMSRIKIHVKLEGLSANGFYICRIFEWHLLYNI